MPDISKKTIRLLFLEDFEDDTLLLLRRFQQSGYTVYWERVFTAEGMQTALATPGRWDAVLSDYAMGTFDACQALALLKQTNVDLPFIIVSGIIDEETAVGAMRAGAHDFLSKSKLDRLVPAVEREIREALRRGQHQAAVVALEESERRFRSLVSSIPGLVFQVLAPEMESAAEPVEPGAFLTHSPSTAASFPKLDFRYVSEGCQMLLGVPAHALMRDGSLILDMLLPEDRADFVAKITTPARERSTLNWEGRLVPAGDPRTKWVNVRATARRLESGQFVWDGILANITLSKTSEQALSENRVQLAELSEHLQTAKEEERERIAREIHDEIGSALVAIKIELSLLASKLDKPVLKDKAKGIASHVNRAMDTAGRVARELRPGILKEFGLVAALESQAEDFAQRTGIACHLHFSAPEIKPSPECALAIFRIFQETLTNVAKHSQATDVEAHLEVLDANLLFSMRDNGKGISVADMKKRRSFGLRGIRERIRALDGAIEISQHPNGGTLIEIQVPMPRTDTARTNPAQYDLPNLEPESEITGLSEHDQGIDC